MLLFSPPRHIICLTLIPHQLIANSKCVWLPQIYIFFWPILCCLLFYFIVLSAKFYLCKWSYQFVLGLQQKQSPIRICCHGDNEGFSICASNAGASMVCQHRSTKDGHCLLTWSDFTAAIPLRSTGGSRRPPPNPIPILFWFQLGATWYQQGTFHYHVRLGLFAIS